MRKLHNLSDLKDRRQELRKNPTLQEEILWWHIKDKRLGAKFRRQHSVGGYILDFYCKEKKLIVEIDGEVHGTFGAKEYDNVRDKFFSDLGYKTLRFSNKEIESNITKIIDKIVKNL